MVQSSSSLLLRFETHLLEAALFKKNQKILIACSGGPDSVALFYLLHALASKQPLELGLVHFNHQLRPGDSEKDERFVKELARKHQTPFFLGTGDVAREARRTQASIEEAARKMRYDFFLRIARTKKYPMVALAHTRDDQAETVLMRVLQGTGLRGLQGIREKFKKDRVIWVRPLLAFAKKELLDHLRRERIPFRLDRSNDSPRFVRNRIRTELIPQLQKDFNPRVVEALSRIPSIVAWESALIEELEGKAWNKVFLKKRGGVLEFCRRIFLKCPAALQFRLIEKALKKLDPQSGLSFEAWERIRRGLRRTCYCCSLPKDIDLALTSKKVTIYKKLRRV